MAKSRDMDMIQGNLIIGYYEAFGEHAPCLLDNFILLVDLADSAGGRDWHEDGAFPAAIDTAGCS